MLPLALLSLKNDHCLLNLKCIMNLPDLVREITRYFQSYAIYGSNSPAKRHSRLGSKRAIQRILQKMLLNSKTAKHAIKVEKCSNRFCWLCFVAWAMIFARLKRCIRWLDKFSLYLIWSIHLAWVQFFKTLFHKRTSKNLGKLTDGESGKSGEERDTSSEEEMSRRARIRA